MVLLVRAQHCAKAKTLMIKEWPLQKATAWIHSWGINWIHRWKFTAQVFIHLNSYSNHQHSQTLILPKAPSPKKSKTPTLPINATAVWSMRSILCTDITCLDPVPDCKGECTLLVISTPVLNQQSCPGQSFYSPTTPLGLCFTGPHPLCLALTSFLYCPLHYCSPFSLFFPE